MNLRPYQEKFIDDIRAAYAQGSRSVVAVAPTGSGKTVCFSRLAQLVQEKGKRISILVHREELLNQVSETLAAFGVDHDVIAAGKWPDCEKPVSVASVFTLVRRLDKVPQPDMVVIDEAHHAVGKSTWGKIIKHWSGALVLGVTATPRRLSGEGLHELFDSMVFGPSVSEMIDQGYLSDYKMFSPSTINTDGLRKRTGDWIKSELELAADKPRITGSAIDHYIKHANGLPAICFCVSIKHAHHVADQFRAAGFSSSALDGKMKKSQRRDIVRRFRTGKIQVLTSCDLISEGFDVPGISCGILLRPTDSLGLYLQQVGRCLRGSDGKDRAIILDHAGNAHRHGLPCEDRDWSLQGHTSKHKSPSVKHCPQCFFVVQAQKNHCPDCGHVFVVAPKPREISIVSGELSETDVIERRYENRRAQSGARSLDDLIELGKQRGYKNAVGWANHVYRARLKRGLTRRQTNA